MLISLCMLAGFTGCGGRANVGNSGAAGQTAQPGAAAGVNMGRWVERELPLENGPEGGVPIGVYLEADGTAGVFWSTWTELFAGPAGQTPERLHASEEEHTTWAARRGSKTAYDLTAKDAVSLMLWENGEAKELTVPWEQSAFVRNLSFADDDTLFAHYMLRVTSDDGYTGYGGSAFAFLNADTGEVLGRNILPEDWYGSMAVNSEHVFALYKNELVVYNRQGEVESELGGQLSVQGDWSGVAATEQNELYFADETGLYRFAAGGSLVETLLPGGSYAFGQPNWYIRQLLPDEEGGVFLLLYNAEEDKRVSNSYKLCHYYFDEALPAKNEQELVIWSLREQPTARAAVMEYQRQHPEMTVTYEPALMGEVSESAVADATTALNTELLAGGGPDVLLLDGLDWQNYAGQGLLAPLELPSGLLQNIVDPLKTDGTQYVLPARFTLPVLLGRQQDLAGLDSMDALLRLIQTRPARPAGMTGDDEDEYYKVRSAEEQYAISFIDQNVLFDYFYPLYSPVLVQNNALNQEALRRMYEQIETVSALYGLPVTAQSNGVDMGGWSADDNLYEFGMGAALGWCNLVDTEMLIYNNASVESPEAGQEFTAAVRAAAQPGAAQGLYTPVCVAAVNLAAQQPAQAQEFVRALLSETVQSSTLGDGLPVLQSAWNTQLAAAKEGKAPFAAADLEALVQKTAAPILQNETLKEKLREPALQLCSGQSSLDEAVQAAQNAAALYLAERQ